MRPLLHARRLLLLALLAILIAPAAASAACPGAGAMVTADTLREGRQAVRCLLNQTRRARGLRPLRHQPLLQEAATRHSLDMTRRHFFAHDSPGGATLVTRALRVGYVLPSLAWKVGENIAWGSGSLSTPASIHRAWMRSPGHKANIVKPAYRHVGVGIAIGSPRGGPGVTYTTDFGARG